jgi:HEAT repeat protein
MPREQLLGLAADVDRLLAAGATAAAGHDGLSRRGRALRELGQKVAALLPVADAVERVTSSSPREVGRAFLDLMVMARQLRGSLAAVGVEGTLQAMDTSGPWQTPTPTRDVYNAHESLTGESSSAALHDAAERQVTGDLRLLPSALAALESSKTSIADAVADKVLPAVGRGVLPDLLVKLNLQKGGNADARRLRAICKIDPKLGAELVRKGLSEGSRALKVQALECLPDVGRPGEAEKAGLALCKEKEKSVRMAALRALRKATRDEALEVLIQALLEDDWQIPQLAQEVLAELPHPKATERLLRETEERTAALPPPVPKPKKGAKKEARKAAEKAEEARQSSIERLGRFIEVLSARKEARNARVLQTLLALARHSENEVRQEALQALGNWGNEFKEVLPVLIAAIDDPDGGVAIAAIEAVSNLAPEKREELIPTLIERVRAPKAHVGVVYSVVGMLPGHMPRFGETILDLMRQLLKSKDGSLRSCVIEALSEIGPPARECLPQIFAELKSSDDSTSYENIFVNIEQEGTTSIPALIALLKERKAVRCNALEGLEGYGPKARAAEELVTKLTKDRDWLVKHKAESTLAAIKGER